MSSVTSPLSPSSSSATIDPSKVVVGGAADDLANGLKNFLEPILLETDEHIKNVVSSQNALSNQIDALQEELRKFSEISKIPALSPYVQKLADAKSRIVNVNQLLDRITYRLDRIHTMAAEQQQQPQQASK